MEWNLVSKKKPESLKIVLLCKADGNICAGYYDENEDFFFDITGDDWRAICWADADFPTLYELDLERL